MSDETPADGLAAQILVRASAAGATVAVAESLTAGLVAATLADVAGISAVLRGGVVAYATELKAQLLGVDPELLAAGGAVQAEVARQMARGVAGRLHSTYGLATTGVAGPDPQDGQPAGTVYVAVHGPDGEVVVGFEGPTRLPGDRAQVRRAAVTAALHLLVDQLPGS